MLVGSRVETRISFLCMGAHNRLGFFITVCRFKYSSFMFLPYCLRYVDCKFLVTLFCLFPQIITFHLNYKSLFLFLTYESRKPLDQDLIGLFHFWNQILGVSFRYLFGFKAYIRSHVAIKYIECVVKYI